MPPPRIYCYCFDNNKPSGGQKDTYQMVDVLNRYGFDAYALHRTPGFRLTWFENETRLAYLSAIEHDAARDYFVVPENRGLRIHTLPGRKVIFNKNIYLGFHALGMRPDSPSVVLSDDVVAILTVSRHNQEYLRYAYPTKPVLLVHYDLRPDLFEYHPITQRRFAIAYNAKATTQLHTLYQMLLSRGLLGLNRTRAVEWVPLIDLSEREVSSVLQEALLLIFLSTEEGLSRLPLEAMACGCLVCAYECGPLHYLPASYRFANGDVLSMAQHVERVLDAYPFSMRQFETVSLEARRIAERHSVTEQERSILDAWECILAQTAEPARAR